jgi:hypothetical protein
MIQTIGFILGFSLPIIALFVIFGNKSDRERFQAVEDAIDQRQQDKVGDWLAKAMDDDLEAIEIPTIEKILDYIDWGYMCDLSPQSIVTTTRVYFELRMSKERIYFADHSKFLLFGLPVAAGAVDKDRGFVIEWRRPDGETFRL